MTSSAETSTGLGEAGGAQAAADEGLAARGHHRPPVRGQAVEQPAGARHLLDAVQSGELAFLKPPGLLLGVEFGGDDPYDLHVTAAPGDLDDVTGVEAVLGGPLGEHPVDHLL
nr:hypothetical protein [Sinosporangium siamense]